MYNCDQHCCCEAVGNEQDKKMIQVSIQSHDTALIANYRFALTEPKNNPQPRLEEGLLKIGLAIKEQGGHIGHIKATVCFKSHGYLLSLTDKMVNKVEISDYTGEVEGVAIVFGVEEKRFVDIIKKSFDSELLIKKNSERGVT